MCPATRLGPTTARVLVVDDDTDTATSMAKFLEIYGHEVRIALDGPAAIAMACAWRPDVILLDLGLPGLDGFEVAARIRREEACRDVVILAVTGYGQPDDRWQTSATGIERHLVKPADLHEVLALVSRHGSPPQADGHSRTGRDSPEVPAAAPRRTPNSPVDHPDPETAPRNDSPMLAGAIGACRGKPRTLFPASPIPAARDNWII